MVLDLLLVIGLLASTVSQFRLSGVPVGPAELCLFLWLCAASVRTVLFERPRLTPVLGLMVTFWVVFIAAMSIGTMTGYLIGDIHDPTWFWHDVAAYVVTCALSCLCLAHRACANRLTRVLWLFVVLGTACLLLQLATAFEVLAVPGIDPWEWDRMRGFTQNANQLALFCTVLGLLALHLAEESAYILKKAMAIAAIALAMIVGQLTESDAFYLAIVVAVPLFLLLKIINGLSSKGRRLSFKAAVAWITVIYIPISLLYAVSFSLAGRFDAGKTAESLLMASARSGSAEAADLRLEIWRSAIDRSVQSGLMGLGPGPHLAIPETIVTGRQETNNEPSRTEHPKFKIIPNFEAHNTILDLLVQGGLLVILDCIGLVGIACFMTLRGKRDGLTAMLFGLGVYSLFHFTFRQPIVWFAIAYTLAISVRERRLRKAPIQMASTSGTFAFVARPSQYYSIASN